MDMSAKDYTQYVQKKAKKSPLLKDVLFLATGAMMSPTSVQQGESIPGIAHLLHLSHNFAKEESSC